MEGHQQEQVALKAFSQIFVSSTPELLLKQVVWLTKSTRSLVQGLIPFHHVNARGNVLPRSSAHICTGQVYTTRVHGRPKLLHLWTHQTEIITSVLVRFNYKCTYVMSVVVILLFRRLTFLLFAMSPGTMYSSRIWCQDKIFFFVICILQQLLYSQTFFLQYICIHGYSR